MKSMIVAYDTSHGIGAHGRLPWGRSLPADLKHFRDMTLGGSIIMGRTTFDAIGKTLPGRENIVVTHGSLRDPTAIAVHSLAEAYAAAHGAVFIIGGGSLYQQALADVDVIYATEVHAACDGADVFFPTLDASWKERSRQTYSADEKNRYAYDFVTYVRTTPQSVL